MLEELNRQSTENDDVYAERLGEGTTRVMVLYRGSGSDELKCDLRKIHLTQGSSYVNLSYDALSYVWGSEEDASSIILCGHPFFVTQNLAEALRHLRRADSDRILWVDAICMNQHDVEERQSQIKSMHRVYQNAETVIAWLGPGDAETCNIFSWMKYAEDFNLTRECYPLTYTHGSNPWERLTTRPYWSRAWVVQETMVARTVFVQCGLSTVLLSTIEKAYSPERMDFIGTRSSNDQAWTHYFTTNWALRLPSAHQPFTNQFLECLLDKQCRDRQDSIFAFLNLFPDDIQQCIPVDYGIPPNEVLLRTARAIIDSTKSLYIFVIRGRQTPPLAPEESWQASMPSWCPYLATPYKSHIIKPQDLPSVFSEEMAVSFLMGDRLRVRGFIIGRISQRVPRKIPPKDKTRASSNSFDPSQEWNYYLRCLRLGMTGLPKYPPTLLASMKATTRTLLAGRDEHNDGEFWLFSLLSEGTEADVDEDSAATATLKKISTNMTSRLMCSFRLSPAVRRALGSGKVASSAYVNSIALVPDRARKGDAISLILGCPLAIVLRRSGTSYRILGEAFIDTSAMGSFKVDVRLRDFIIR